MSEPTAVRPEDLLAELGWVRQLARRLVRDADQADDLLQDTCVAALENAPRDRTRLRAWLGRIARNLARQNVRAELARQRREDRASRGEAQRSVLETLERASIQHELAGAVFRLHPAYRDTVLMRFFEGLPPRDIARRMGTTPAMVNNRLARALAQLRRELDRVHGGDRERWLAALLPLSLPTLSLPTALLPTALLPTALLPTGLLQPATRISRILCAWTLLLPMKAKLLLVGLAAVAIGVLLDGTADDAVPPQARAGERSDATAALASHDAAAPGGEAAGGDLQRELAPPAAAAGTTPTWAVTGRVLACDGSPMSDVAVRVAEGPPATATSDASGRFVLHTGTGSGEVVAAADDLVTVLAGTFAADSSIELAVVVAPRLELAGEVLDEHGAAIAAAQLRLYLPRDFTVRFADRLDRARGQQWHATSAPGGAFELAAPAVAGAVLRVARAPFAPGVFPAPQHTDRGMRLVLRSTPAEGEMVRGRVVDEHGSPVAGARVGLGRTSYETREDGRFDIAIQKAGSPRRLVAVKEGYQPVWFEPQCDTEGMPIWLPHVELCLQARALEISGQVLDRDGGPVAGALVWALDTTAFGDLPVRIEFMVAGGGMPPHQPLELPVVADPAAAVRTARRMDHQRSPAAYWFYVTAGPDGRFTLAGLLPRAYRLRAMHPESGLMATSEPIEAGARAAEVRMPADATHPAVTGRIVDEHGQPLADVRVLVVVEVHSIDYRLADEAVHHQLIRHGQRTATDPSGRFCLRDVPRERAILSIYGDRILPRISALDGLGDPTDLEITVRGRYHLQVVLDDPGLADSFGVTDAHGARRPVARIRAGSHDDDVAMPLHQGRSDVVAVGGDADEVVLLKHGQVVASVPVRLVAGETVVVRR